mgnify:CR=1 FL=1
MLLKTLRVILDAVELAKSLSDVIKLSGDLPPAHYTAALKRFNARLLATYDEHYTEDFQLLIAWSPKHR